MTFETIQVGVTLHSPAVTISAYGMDTEAPSDVMDFAQAFNSMVVMGMHLAVADVKLDVPSRTATVTSAPFLYPGHANATLVATVQRIGDAPNVGVFSYEILDGSASLFSFVPIQVNARDVNGKLTGDGVGIQVIPKLPGQSSTVL